MKLISLVGRPSTRLSWHFLPMFPLLNLFLFIILYLHPLNIYPMSLKVLDSKLMCQLITTDFSTLGFNNYIVYLHFINGYQGNQILATSEKY